MSKRTKPNFKPTKTYKEYIKMFKEACNNLERALFKSELERHEFDLPTENYFLKNCPNKKVKDYNSFLVWLGYEPNYKHHNNRTYTIEIAREEFLKRDLVLLEDEYINSSVRMKYYCKKHPDIIQYKSMNALMSVGRGCYYCGRDAIRGENNFQWKGGISPLNIYLRENINPWKKDSMANCNYKCVITGESFDDIHHLYSFNKIIEETLKQTKLPTYKNINEYTNNEIKLLEKTCLEIHYKYPLGVCLCKKVHDLYHHIYGFDNTPEQFEEFKERYNNGEFKELLLKAS